VCFEQFLTAQVFYSLGHQNNKIDTTTTKIYFLSQCLFEGKITCETALLGSIQEFMTLLSSTPINNQWQYCNIDDL